MKKGDVIYCRGVFIGAVLDMNSVYVKVLSDKILFLEKRYISYWSRGKRIGRYTINSEYLKNYLKVHNNLCSNEKK